MALFRITIRLESPLVTALKGDTIWGHVVWGIANHEGEAAVQKFLDDCNGNEPAFVTSSAFPSGFICKPLYKPNERNKRLSPDDYAQIKKLKKVRYERASDYLDLQESKRDGGENPFKSVVLTHNSMDRFSNTVIDGGIYAIAEMWSSLHDFDVYIASSYPAERVEQLLIWAFENGYGADASTGKGKISVTGKATEVHPRKKGCEYMALAPFVLPSQSGVANLRADTFVRNGKIGGNFESEMVPWKKTVILYDEGAVFTSETPMLHVGMLVKGVHSDARICQSGFSPVIPISD